MNRKEIENVECINFEEIQHKISRFYELANSLNYEVKKISFGIVSKNIVKRVTDILEEVQSIVSEIEDELNYLTCRDIYLIPHDNSEERNVD